VLASLVLSLTTWQPEASAGAGAAGGAGGAPPGCAGGGGMQIGMLLVMFVVFYFLIIRPQQKRQREHDDMLKALRKGQVVRTTGGIRGEIVEIDDREVTLRIAEKTKINVLRSHVAGPEGSPSAMEEPKKD
jgi:preprotein translocase subunit YajC